ncbi:sugar-binding domain-containing protein [Asaia sp. HN010]|uniref:sugar-binding transcriptional regulator n=1 Tax=Asaia sp. HN010 TaxID=3081233 RepID=UPI00301788A7
MGPAERLLAIEVARDYYLNGLSKIEIGTRHGISRFKVARILEESLESGLVKIQIDGDRTIDSDLSARLQTHYGLRHALVLSGPFVDTPSCRAALGKAAAELLEEVATEQDVLGVAWGRTIDVVAETIRSLPGCRVVQMTGVAGSVENSSIDLVRRFAQAAKGVSLPIYAPLIVSDEQALAVIARQSEIREAIASWPDITLAVVAIGSASETGSQVSAVLTDAERAELSDKNMVCEICALPMDSNGDFVETSMAARTLAIPFQTLHDIPHVMAVAGGADKHKAILAALRSGIVTTLVTDHETASFLLG